MVVNTREQTWLTHTRCQVKFLHNAMTKIDMPVQKPKANSEDPDEALRYAVSLVSALSVFMG